jgi:hypothetical protein
MTRAVAWGLWLAVLALGCTKGPGEPCKRGMGECRKDLLCEGSSQPVCVACADTEGCARDALCTMVKGKCALVGEDDCLLSDDCRKHGMCSYSEKERSCFNPKSQEGGCPCGCDHSEAMIDTLRTAPAADALGEARQSLATIAEREALGYITDAMVEHRLRLRALEADLSGGGAPAGFPLTARAIRLREARSHFPAAHAGDLSVRSELVAFGATTEVVAGKEKALPACFRLWLELENSGTRAITIDRPALTGSTRFDVRRWYIEDGDGAPWSGRLAPGERRSVLLIGYVGERLSPGTAVRASFEVGDVGVHADTVALGRWDARANAPR